MNSYFSEYKMVSEGQMRMPQGLPPAREPLFGGPALLQSMKQRETSLCISRAISDRILNASNLLPKLRHFVEVK